jgi:membrane-associated phospholipid phosphatase
VLFALLYVGVASAVMIWRGVSVSPDYLLLMLVPVALASGRFFRFVGDWVPFIAIFLGYEAMRGIASKTGIPPQVDSIAGLEKGLFGGHLPTTALQGFMDSLHIAHGVDYAATVVYFAHFVVPVLIGVTLWLKDRVLFLRFVTALLGMSFAGFLIFLLIPTAPPWWAQDHGVLSGFRHVIGTTLPSAVSPYYNSLNPNPVAAFPSLHAAYPLLGFLMLRRAYPRAAWIVFGWCLVVWFSVVYLGEHYFVDVLAGIALVALTELVMNHVVIPRVPALRERGEEPPPEPQVTPLRKSA